MTAATATMDPILQEQNLPPAAPTADMPTLVADATADETPAESPAAVDPSTRPPRTHVDSKPLPTDSMVTVSLSEAGGNSVADDDVDECADKDAKKELDDCNDNKPANDCDDDKHANHTNQTNAVNDCDADQTTNDPEPDKDGQDSVLQPEIVVDEQRLSDRPTSSEIHKAFGRRDSQASICPPAQPSPTVSVHNVDGETPTSPGTPPRSRSGSGSSAKSTQVDWVELDRKETEQQANVQPSGDSQEDEMKLLLARLDQENKALESDSKAALRSTRARSQSRPPSFNQIKDRMQNITELDFWAALVREYPRAVQRIPAMCSHKIRAGVPQPLRGVVWQSASGARDKVIEDQYDVLCGESSPYENIINKDLGRSFPGVDMFKDPEGEGQKMLGRVLKCFSLYDHKIGYCQGLGFLVGPLLMQMGDKEAFCVLVKLMEDYDLRSCFLPDLSGLHLRIFQFQQLLAQHMPQLAQHLDDLEVQSAYLSQWFLSFFAVTCPLPMLFRIYDVLFAEGASETIMRVALALMKRNEAKLLSLTEFEDVLQLLLGRQLWDPYGRRAGSADELVDDFCSFSNAVTKERLQGLEQQYRDAQEKDSATAKQQVQKSATSFLGRLWPSNSSTKSMALSPGLTAPSRPVSFLRRTPSKQSLASTLHSTAESDMSGITQSTALTDISRQSQGDALSLKSGHGSVAIGGHSAKDRDLHYQIEQLLMSVSQLQRQNSELEAALQKQREDRAEDHRIVRTVVDKIRKKAPTLAVASTRESRRRTTITATTALPTLDDASAPALSESASEIVTALEERFPATHGHHRASSMFETKQILRDNLSRTKEQLSSETMRAQALARELNDKQADLNIAREALKDTRTRLQDSYNQNQKQEKALQELRSNARKASATSSWGGGGDTSPDTPPTLSRSTTSESSTGGLRELRLGRTASQKSSTGLDRTFSQKSAHDNPRSKFAKRTSSLMMQPLLTTSDPSGACSSPIENDNLLAELVSAKTSEAVARQELEEMRIKFEGMKRALNTATGGGSIGGSSSISSAAGSATASPASTPTLSPATLPIPSVVEKPAEAKPAVSTGWGWGWKRSVSQGNVAA